MYIGTQQGTAAPVLLDAITVVNGQAAYTMQKGGVNYSPASTLVMQVSLNGIIQAPNSSYTINGSTITFDSALVTGDVIDYILVREPTTGTIAPVDGSITTSKLASGAVTDAKITSMASSKLTGALPAIDGSALTGVSSGKVLTGDWVNYNDGLSLTSNNSFTEISTSFRPSITVQDTSSRIQIIGQISGMSYTGNDFPYYRIERSINGGAFSGEASTATTDNTALNAKQNSSSVILGFAAGAGHHSDNGDGIDTTTFNWIWDHDATAGDTLTLRFMVRTRSTNFRLNYTSNNSSQSLSAISGFGMIEVLI
ncbi:hypothetical protein N9Y31_03285 [Alphaproteobacteria bacterium]|nr:hypothetical protein [Alphaproteobacteria bacterium]